MSDTNIKEMKSDLQIFSTLQDVELTERPFRVVCGKTAKKPFELKLHLTRHFFGCVKKHKGLINDPRLFKAIINLRYGYDPALSMSSGGRDGIFAVTRNYKPTNEMIEKLYNRFYDTVNGKNLLKRHFGNIEYLHGVRVVCHSLRLLGFLDHSEQKDIIRQKLVLVDLDVNVQR